MTQIVVIGGGAAGFFGAIQAAESNPQAHVIILEAAKEPLVKVRISGGGRCNVTHHCFDTSQLVNYYPRGGKALRGAFSRFQPQDTIKWFESRGVKLKTEADGRMFPITDNSETIVNCLRDAASFAGVHLMLNSAVKSVEKQAESFTIELKRDYKIAADKILIATGSSPFGYRTAQDLGHSLLSPVPSLFTFQISDPRLKDLLGVSVDKVRVRLGGSNLEQIGPLLITHWGVSGPAILKLSAWGARVLHDHHYKMPLIINWLTDYHPEKLREILSHTKSEYPKRKIFNYCPFDELPKRLWQSLLIHLTVKAANLWAELSKNTLNQLITELHQGEYQIKGKGVFKEEFVTCGGVSLKEVDFKTMESKICPGLYFAGEVLDIDGVTGGFNFQSAWTTGYLAGQGMDDNRRPAKVR
jgi:predicted Rossmann fold flavoprotein